MESNMIKSLDDGVTYEKIQQQSQYDTSYANSNKDDSEHVHYETTCYRWLCLLLIFNVTLCTSVVGLCLSPISLKVAAGFDVNIEMVNACSIIITVVFIPQSIGAIKMYESLKFGTVLRLGSVAFALGGWIRQFCNANAFWPCILGNGVMALANPIFLSAITPLCNKWFGDKERSLAAALLGLATPIGGILGLVAGPVYFKGVDEDTTAPSIIIDDFNTMVFQQNCYMTVSAFLLIVFIRSEPKIPPSSVALQKPPPRRFDKMIWEALRNVNYVIIIYNYGVFYGIYIALGALLSPILSPYGYSDTDIALIGIFFISCGVIGIFIFGFILDKYKKFRLLFRLIGLGGGLCVTLTIFVIPAGKPVPTMILCLLGGFCVLPCIPICLSFSGEVTFPLNAAMTNGLLQLAGHSLGLIIQVTSAALVAVSPVWCLIGFTIFALTGSVSCLFVKEDLKRLKFAQASKAAEMLGDDLDIKGIVPKDQVIISESDEIAELQQ